MPYKSEKIRIEGTSFDRRKKLTDDQKEYIKWLREEENVSYMKLAGKFNVSKRTIQFIVNPDRYKKCLEQRRNRGKDGRYYCKKKNAYSVRETRRYKQKLYIDGEIS